MRDDSQRWGPPRDRAREVTAPGITIRSFDIARLTLISGPAALSATQLALVDWPGVTEGDSYAISLRRDRVLEVNGPARPDGWDANQNLAISDVTDAYTHVEITGPATLSLLNRGTELDPDTPSRSAARLLFGLGVFLYRHSNSDTYRIHAGSAQDEALWHALKDAAKHLT
ncbi:MAG: hypothetical protein AAF280_07250 [Pseudomonadota bacterium]